jgi:hypothetical protein
LANGGKTGEWLAALDDFRNWVTLGLWPAKANENQWQVTMAPAGAARSNQPVEPSRPSNCLVRSVRD